MQTLYVIRNTYHLTSIMVPGVSDTSIFTLFSDYRTLYYVLYAIE